MSHMTQTLSPIDTSILHTIARSGGIELTMSNLGATLVALRVPDRRGEPGDILLGCDNDADYRAQTAYLGASIGPIANRIKGACVPLCGRSVQLDANENGNTLHNCRQGLIGKCEMDTWMPLPETATDHSANRRVTGAPYRTTGSFPARRANSGL